MGTNLIARRLLPKHFATLALLILMMAGVGIGGSTHLRAAGPVLPTCAVTPDLASGQGFTPGGLGFTVGGLGFTVSGLGFTPGGLGFTPGGLGENADQLAALEIKANPITPAWLTNLIPDIAGGPGYNSTKTAVLIIDNFENDPNAHGKQVKAVFDALAGAVNVSNIGLFPVDISEGGDFQTDGILDKIKNKVDALKTQGYKHFVLNMSFGLVPCSDPGEWTLPNGQTAPAFNFADFLKARAVHNKPYPAPNPPISAECLVFSPLPKTRLYRNGDADYITLFGGGPVAYNWTGEFTNDGYRVWGSGSGMLINPGDFIEFKPPLMGNWGPPNGDGAFESHITIHFNSGCGYKGYDWDRWHHTYAEDTIYIGLGLTQYLADYLGVDPDQVGAYMKHLVNEIEPDQLQGVRGLLQDYLANSVNPNHNFAVIPVASSGNFRHILGPAALSPASLPETIATSATLGNFGPQWRFAQDGNVIAPGAGFQLSPTSIVAGTSFASPYVSMASAMWLTYPNACTFDGHLPPLTSSATSKFVNAPFAPGVNPLNCKKPQPPDARDDQYTIQQDTVLNVAAPGVLGNDTDPDGDSLTAMVVSNPSHGSLSLAANGAFTYTPNAGYSGSDSFTYKADDGQGGTDTATVAITVKAVPKCPVFEPFPTTRVWTNGETDKITLKSGGPVKYQYEMVLTTNNHQVIGTGSGTLNPGDSIIFTYPPIGSWGPADLHGAHATHTTVHLNGPCGYVGHGWDRWYHDQPGSQNTNKPPVATSDNFSIQEDQVLNVTAPGVLTNDSDPDGNPLQAAVKTQPAHGTLSLNANGSFTFTPHGNYNGPDGFSYTVNDGKGGTATASVKITVTPINDPPSAKNDAYSTNQDAPLNVAAKGVLNNDQDIDGDALSATVVTGPSHAASFTLNPDGSFSYTPAAGFYGDDNFSYKADDGHGGSATASVKISVKQVNVNQPPTAGNDNYSVDENATLNIAAPGVLGNDTDPNGDPLQAAVNTLPSNGALTLNPDGSFSYKPNAGFSGPDSFTYTASDGKGGTATATVNITVNKVIVTPECPVFEPFPQTRNWSNGDTDAITLKSGGPVQYRYQVVLTNKNNEVIGKGKGTLNNGETLTITYPPIGDAGWGPANADGARVAQITIHMEGKCGYIGHNWGRWYHDKDGDGIPD